MFCVLAFCPPVICTLLFFPSAVYHFKSNTHFTYDVSPHWRQWAFTTSPLQTSNQALESQGVIIMYELQWNRILMGSQGIFLVGKIQIWQEVVKVVRRREQSVLRWGSFRSHCTLALLKISYESYWCVIMMRTLTHAHRHTHSRTLTHTGTHTH